MPFLFCTSLAYGDLSSCEIIHSYVNAYNAHEVDGMLVLVSDDIRWMSVDGDNIRIEVAGKDALGSNMSAYFESLPSARSEIQEMSMLGDFVTVVEAAIWTSGGSMRSQCAISVYQLSGDVISNIWYYPARPCEQSDD